MEISENRGYTERCRHSMLRQIILTLALASPLAAQPATSRAPAADKDLCSYLKDVEAKSEADCATGVPAALGPRDAGAYTQVFELARRRKMDVLAVYDFLKATPFPGKESALPASLTPPINERTFLAWVGPESNDIYARWLRIENKRLQQEGNNPVSPERKKEIASAIATNQSKIAALGKLTSSSGLSCAIGEACEMRSALVDPTGAIGMPGKGSWTAADYARANAQPEAQRLSIQNGLDRGIPELGPIAAEAIANTPLGPLTEKQTEKNSSPYRTAAELALAATGGFLLFGGLGGKSLEVKFPNIRRNMGIAAGVSGVMALGAISLAPVAPAVTTAAPVVETAAGTTGSLTPGLAGGGTLASSEQSISLFQAALKTVGIGGGVLVLKEGLQHVLSPSIPPFSSSLSGMPEPIFAKPPHDAKNPNGAKAPGKPGKAEGFSDPKSGENWGQAKNGEWGWVDAHGNVWVPTGKGSTAHGGTHWDVQKRNGSHDNVYPGGRQR